MSHVTVCNIVTPDAKEHVSVCCHVTDTSNLTLPEQEMHHKQLTGVKFNACGCVVIGLVIVEGCHEEGKGDLDVSLCFFVQLFLYWSPFTVLIQMG